MTAPQSSGDAGSVQGRGGSNSHVMELASAFFGTDVEPWIDQFQIVILLLGQRGLPAKVIAECIDQEPSRVSQAVLELERAGLAVRGDTVKGDGQVGWHLTEEGASLVSLAQDTYVQHGRELLAQVNLKPDLRAAALDFFGLFMCLMHVAIEKGIIDKPQSNQSNN